MSPHLTDLAIRPGTERIWTAAELRAEGWSYDRIVEAAKGGELHRLLHGVYLEGDELTERRRVVAALKYLDQRVGVGRTPASATGDTGLAGHGVLAGEPRCPPLIAVDARSRPRAPHGFFDVVRHTLAPEELSLANGLRVAPLMRCLVDAERQDRVTDATLRTAVDAIRIDRRWLMPAIVRGWRAAGARQSGRLETMLDSGTFEQESDGERDCFAKLFVPHPPIPDCQVVVHGPFRADFVFLAAGLVIEYHGKDAHANAVERDATRTLALESAGYRVIVVTASMLRDPLPLVQHIHSLRRSRQQQISSGELRLPLLPTQPERLSPLRTIHPQG